MPFVIFVYCIVALIFACGVFLGGLYLSNTTAFSWFIRFVFGKSELPAERKARLRKERQEKLKKLMDEIDKTKDEV